VAAWGDWNLRSNTHFGSLVLLIPLALAAGRMAGHERAGHEHGQETKQDESQENGPDDGVDDGLEEELARVLRSTTVQDALDFYRAFDLAGARVVQVDDFSLKDPDWERKLIDGNQSLLELMRLSLDHDIVAREWATDFERSFQLAGRLREMVSIYGLNDGVVRTFLEALAEVPDSLISAKFGRERAVEVSRMAVDALLDSTLNKARKMDCELNNRDMNPGSTADLIAASLFISLLRRLRF
jgi:triphosphoribosyl-dephospho-CoA synthase